MSDYICSVCGFEPEDEDEVLYPRNGELVCLDCWSGDPDAPGGEVPDDD